MFVRKPTNTKLTDEEARQIKYEIDRGLVKIKDVAEEYGVTTSTIRSIWNGKTYRDL